jgi:hypothetical protein
MIANLLKPSLLKQILVLTGLGVGTFWLGSRLVAPLSPAQPSGPVTIANASAMAASSDPRTAPGKRDVSPRIDAAEDANPTVTVNPVKSTPFTPTQKTLKPKANQHQHSAPSLHPVRGHDNGLHKGWVKHHGDEGDKHAGHGDDGSGPDVNDEPAGGYDDKKGGEKD